jgi:hypothetical protein
VFSISRFINLTDANNGKIIACVTFGTVWWGRGTNPNRRIKSDLVVACLVVIGSWVLVAFLVLVPAGIHRNPSDLYFSPTPVNIFFAIQAQVVYLHI